MLCGRDRYEAEVAVRIDDGTVQWFALTVRRTGPAGAAPQAIVVLSDIARFKSEQVKLEHLASEHGRMARVLGQQVDRTRAVLDSVLVGIVTVDEGGRIAWLNRSARRMFGGDLGDFLGQSLDTVASEESDHPFRRTLSMVEALRDGEAVQFECRVQARDGRDFWVVGNAVATLGAQGERELTWALMDIDQRRQAEARIAEARASLQHIIEAAPMAIAVCDAVTLAVLHVNRVAEALMAGDVLVEAIGGGEPCRPTPPAVVLRDDLRVALARPDAGTQREYTLRRQGTNEGWEARFLPLGRAGGAIDQILLVATDVTVQRAAQRAELQAAIAQREMLVQEVHHRIKNNLQGVAGLMQQAALQHPEVRPVIAEVVGQVQAIAQVYGLQVGRVGLLAVHSVIEAIAQSVQRMFGRVITVAVAAAGPGALGAAGERVDPDRADAQRAVHERGQACGRCGARAVHAGARRDSGGRRDRQPRPAAGRFLAGTPAVGGVGSRTGACAAAAPAGRPDAGAAGRGGGRGGHAGAAGGGARACRP